MNKMKDMQIEKLTLNIGAGKEQTRLEKGIILLQNLTGITPVKTITNKRIPSWGLRPGLPIGCKLTLRGKKAEELLVRLLKAKDGKLSPNQVDDNGSVAIGLHEYVDVPGMEYSPEIGIMGFQACITLERPGFRIKKRRIMKRKISNKHKITKEEAIDFFKSKFNVNFEE